MSDLNAFEADHSNLGGEEIATWSDFFRPENRNGLVLARRVAAAYLISRPEGERYRVADVGSSRGADTLSLAAALLINGIDAEVVGHEINPVAIEQAQQPYPLTMQQLAEKAQRWRLPAATLDLFEKVGRDHVQAGPELRGRVNFRQADLRTDALEAGAFDAVTANNVLSYYANGPLQPQLGAVVSNVVAGMRPHATLTVNSYFDGFQPAFSDHGLVPVARLCEDISRPTFFEVQQ